MSGQVRHFGGQVGCQIGQNLQCIFAKIHWYILLELWFSSYFDYWKVLVSWQSRHGTMKRNLELWQVSLIYLFTESSLQI